MSSQKHTPAPWEIVDFERNDESGFVLQTSENVIAWLFTRSKNAFCRVVPSSMPSEANAARIAACVNAMEGIDDPAAARALLDDPRTAAATDMLEALRLLLREYNREGTAVACARAAIAKAEGR